MIRISVGVDTVVSMQQFLLLVSPDIAFCTLRAVLAPLIIASGGCFPT